MATLLKFLNARARMQFTEPSQLDALARLLPKQGDSFRCHWDFPFVEDSFPGPRTVFTSWLIIMLTIALEVVVNAQLSKTTMKTASTNPRSDNDSDDIADNEAQPSQRKFIYCVENPSQKIRAFRLLVAVCLVTPLCVAFAYRITDANFRYPNYCTQASDIHIPSPNWLVITIVNIVPFACGCAAFLRALTDVVLARWRKSVEYKWWPVFAPVVVPARFVIGILRNAMFRWMQTEPETGYELHSSAIQEEERIGLVDGADSRKKGDDEETLYSPTISEAAKIGEEF